MKETLEQSTARKFKESLFRSMGMCHSFIVGHGHCWNRARFFVLPLGYRFCHLHVGSVLNIKNRDTYTVHTLRFP